MTTDKTRAEHIDDDAEVLSSKTRHQLMSIIVLSCYEAGVINDYPWVDEKPVIDMKQINETTFQSEFQITEDGERARDLINDRLPTIAITQRTFTGQLELMASNLLDFEDQRYNIVGLTGTSIERLAVFKGKVYAIYGFMVQPNGEILYGEFPTPVEVSAIEEIGLTPDSRAVLKSTDCKLFSGDGLSEQFLDKSSAKELLRQASLPVCPGVVCTGVDQIADIDAFLSDETTQGRSEVVIKPCRGQCGSLVSYCNVSDINSISSKIEEILAKGDRAIVERFVKPFEIVDDNSRQILGATIRAASIGSMSQESLKDLMFARVNKIDGPINVFIGAQKMPIEWLLKKANMAGLNAQEIMKDIISCQLAIRNMGIETFGADYIIDQDGNIHLIEVNNTYFGAMPFIDHDNPMKLSERIHRMTELVKYFDI